MISGEGRLIKAGAGVQTLSGQSTYTGSTQVNSGTLRLGTENALPTGTDLSIASGATFDLNDFRQTVAALGGSAT